METKEDIVLNNKKITEITEISITIDTFENELKGAIYEQDKKISKCY